jgi:hypothetical protein
MQRAAPAPSPGLHPPRLLSARGSGADECKPWPRQPPVFGRMMSLETTVSGGCGRVDQATIGSGRDIGLPSSLSG